VDSERLKPIAFCGENPVMELFSPGTETISAAASYWHCTYSPYGEGQVLLLYLDTANATALGQPNAVIYADNEPLARYLTNTFNQHFDGWKPFGFKEAAVREAAFTKESDMSKFYKVTCHADKTIIDVLWSDIRSSDYRSYSDLNGGGFGAAADEHFHVSHSLFLCGQGHMTINQQPVIGTGYTHTLPDDRFTSSVFVALAETWIKFMPQRDKI